MAWTGHRRNTGRIKAMPENISAKRTPYFLQRGICTIRTSDVKS